VSNDFEDQVRRALRPVDPSDGFAGRVMLRVAESSKSRAWLATRHWMTVVTVALAASAIFAIGLTLQWREKQDQAGIEARRQLLEALRVTGAKLDLAYQVVNGDSHSTAQDPGS